MKRFVFWVIMLLTPVLFLTAAAEVYYHLFRASYRVYQYHELLGWAPVPSLTYESEHRDSAGNGYVVKMTTNEHGFRAWGNTNTNKPKILFIGDSFTGDPNMSDDESYFAKVGRDLDVEVFAFGGGGYGTLQELLVLEQYVDLINPDVFVLQYSPNDLQNNSYVLEEGTIVRNQKNLRPYWLDGQIVYRSKFGNWYRNLYIYSAIFRFIDIKVQQLQYKRYKGYWYPGKAPTEFGSEQLTEAERITEALMEMMADTLPENTRLLTFTSSTKWAQFREPWLRISERAGFTPLPAVSEEVERAAMDGYVVTAEDGAHWSPTGHAIVGKTLTLELSRIIEK